MRRLQIGDVTVSRLEEVYAPAFPVGQLLPSSDLAEVEHLGDRLPQFVQPGDDMALVSVHSWLVQTPQHNILIDTCNGNHKERALEGFGMLDLPWLDTLAEAGVDPTQIDYVVCTHLHLDHVGWNTMLDGTDWVPTFPNAKAIINQVDFDFWNPTNPDNAALAFNANVFDDSVQPLVDRDRVILWDGEGYTVDDALHLTPAPGHSPGMCIGHLESKGERGLFSADSMHSPLQIWRPDWFCGFDLVPDQAVEARTAILRQAAESNAQLLAAHFPDPFVFRVRAEGDGFCAVDA